MELQNNQQFEALLLEQKKQLQKEGNELIMRLSAFANSNTSTGKDLQEFHELRKEAYSMINKIDVFDTLNYE